MTGFRKCATCPTDITNRAPNARYCVNCSVARARLSNKKSRNKYEGKRKEQIERGRERNKNARD